MRCTVEVDSPLALATPSELQCVAASGARSSVRTITTSMRGSSTVRGAPQPRPAPPRSRTVRTKGSLSPTTARLMVFKLVIAASKTWRRLKGENSLPLLIAGVTFTDGVAATATADQRAA